MILLSQVVYILNRKIYSMSDNIFEEGETSERMYFIAKGGVRLLHLKTKTYIKEISDNASFGEACFFSSRKRCCTARSSTFTEMLELHTADFETILDNHEDEKALYLEMREEIFKKDDLTCIRVK